MSFSSIRRYLNLLLIGKSNNSYQRAKFLDSIVVIYYFYSILLVIFFVNLASPFTVTTVTIKVTHLNDLYYALYGLLLLLLSMIIFQIVYIRANKENLYVQSRVIKRIIDFKNSLKIASFGFIIFFIVLIFSSIPEYFVLYSNVIGILFFGVGISIISVVAMGFGSLLVFFSSPGGSKRRENFKSYMRRERILVDYEAFGILKQFEKWPLLTDWFSSFLFVEAKNMMNRVIRRGLPRLKVESFSHIMTDIQLVMNPSPAYSRERVSVKEFFAKLENLPKLSREEGLDEPTKLISEVNSLRISLSNIDMIRDRNSIKGVWGSALLDYFNSNLSVFTFLVIVVGIVISASFSAGLI